MRSVVVAFALTWLSLAPSAAADAPIVIKFSHVAAPQSHKSRAAEHFKELAERYTNGGVRIELYPNSQLYKDKEELEALQLGAVQMLAPSVSKFGPLGIKAFEVFDLPYMFAGLRTPSRKSRTATSAASFWASSNRRGLSGSPIGTTASRSCRPTARFVSLTMCSASRCAFRPRR